MIKDTCPCGAKFETNGNYRLDMQEDHKRFLDAHAVCREKLPPARVSPWPFYREKMGR